MASGDVVKVIGEVDVDLAVTVAYGQDITAGEPVRISLGTLGEEASKVSSFTETVHVQGSFDAIAMGQDSAYDVTSGKIIKAYQGVAIGYLRVGTVLADTVTWGPAVQFASDIDYSAICYDESQDKFILAYTNAGASHTGTIRTCTIDGDSVTLGTVTTYGITKYVKSLVYDSNSQKSILAYQDGSSSISTAIASVTGDAVTLSATTLLSSVSSYGFAGTFDFTNNKTIFVYGTTNADPRAVTVEIVNDALILGIVANLGAGDYRDMSLVFASKEGKSVLSFYDNDNSKRGGCRTLEVNGNSLIVGSEQLFESTYADATSLAYSPKENRIVLTYGFYNGAWYGRMRVLTLTGTAISYSGIYAIYTGNETGRDLTYAEQADRFVFTYSIQNGSAYFRVIEIAAETRSECIGVAQETGLAGEVKRVMPLGQISATHTGATVGNIAYIQDDGSLGESITSYELGRFISETKLLLTKNP